MTRDEQERVARVVLGWTQGQGVYWRTHKPKPRVAIIQSADDPRWLWPLRVALEEAEWVFSRDSNDDRDDIPAQWWEAENIDTWVGPAATPADITNAAALIELAAREEGK